MAYYLRISILEDGNNFRASTDSAASMAFRYHAGCRDERVTHVGRKEVLTDDEKSKLGKLRARFMAYRRAIRAALSRNHGSPVEQRGRWYSDRYPGYHPSPGKLQHHTIAASQRSLKGSNSHSGWPQETYFQKRVRDLRRVQMRALKEMPMSRSA